MSRLVIFDFCETLVSIQTADYFIEYLKVKTGHKSSKSYLLFIKFLKLSKLRVLINKLIPSYNIDKRLKLFEIRGMESRLVDKFSEEFIDEEIIPKIIPETLKLLHFHQTEGDTILLISGGYLPYLSLFAKKYNIKYVSGTKMEIVNHKVTGLINGRDCMREQKVLILESIINEFKLNSNESIVYTDSITDLPILQWANKGVVVSKSNNNNNNNWVTKYGFDLLLYNGNN